MYLLTLNCYDDGKCEYLVPTQTVKCTSDSSAKQNGQPGQLGLPAK
jgi:hypothetical protein